MEKQSVEKRILDFEQMAFGMFVHWGAYSQLGKGEWAKTIPGVPEDEYEQMVKAFRGDRFDADALVALAKKTGMKYITFTTRHHDGFSLYDAGTVGGYNSVDYPAKRDFIAEFVKACSKGGIKPFLYHTTLDWHHPCFDNDFKAYLKYLKDSVEILCTRYGEIGGLWFDGNWSKDENWELDELYSMIRKHQPNAMIINNSGLSAAGEVCHPEIDSVTFEQQLPTAVKGGDEKKHLAGEMCYTINDNWGYGKKDFNFKTPAQLIKALCTCRKSGANMLLNIGPDGNGEVPLMVQATLETIGCWMDIYGKAIYDGRPCGIKGENEDFGLLDKEGHGYLFFYDLPIVGNEAVTVNNKKAAPRSFDGMQRKIKEIRWMDNGLLLDFSQNTEKGFASILPTGYEFGSNMVVRVAQIEFE